MQAALAIVAIGYGAWQLAFKIREKQKELGDDESLSTTWIIKEVTFTLGLTTITFLTGGLADMIPDLPGFASEASEWLADSPITHWGEAKGVHFGENPQDINVGSAADVGDLIRGLREKEATTGEKPVTHCRNIGTIKDVLAQDPLQVGQLVQAGTVKAVAPPTDGKTTDSSCSVTGGRCHCYEGRMWGEGGGERGRDKIALSNIIVLALIIALWCV